MLLCFEKLRIAEKKFETSNMVVISFDLPKEIKHKFDYLPGQYLTIQSPLNEKERRCYSICSGPYDEHLKIAVKEVKGGHLSPYLVHNIKVGDVLDVSQPLGNFHLDQSKGSPTQYIMVAGGSGITPIKSMIEHLLAKNSDARISLIFGNQSADQTPFLQLLKQYSSAKQLSVQHIWKEESGNDLGLKGLLTYENCYQLLHHELLRRQEVMLYTCGPGPVMDNVKKAGIELGIKPKNIFQEYFSTKQEGVVGDTPELYRQVVKIVNGKSHYNLPVEKGETILQAAIQNNIPLNYSCKIGICSTCKCKLTSGSVHSGISFGLSQQEKDEGYILTCQAFPLQACTIEPPVQLKIKKNKWFTYRKSAITVGSCFVSLF